MAQDGENSGLNMDFPVNPEPQIDFPVVGIGASAGGLEAVTSMFHKIEPNLGLAYVLVMHLDPNHESLMVELLSRKTRVKVKQIASGTSIEPDCLHVIPPGYSLSMDGSYFKLEKFEEPRGLRRPIDAFFASLAKVQGEKCACVVLSGTGADGTAGLRIGKDLGGVIAVQTPEEARYDGMPFSAISTNLIDFTLSADEIIPRLWSYFQGHQEAAWQQFENADITPDSGGAASRVIELIRYKTGNDFSGYKPSMLLRRMRRRMQVKDQPDFFKFVATLEEDPSEIDALGQDFLINVTSFFRDREQFEVMRNSVLVPLLTNTGPSDEVRIWIPGCSSGQEAYSMAMIVDKTCQELGCRPLIQIFATDIDEDMLTRARRGEYLITEFADLPQAYQDNYTVALDGKFEVTSKIRDMVRFSTHNLIQDPPFSKIDLISCRNLLIYLGEDLQTELFPVLHFSLKPGGHLFLGTSESISRQNDLFTTVDQTARVFRRLETHKRVNLNMPLTKAKKQLSRTPPSQKMDHERDFPEYRSLNASNDEIYQEYAPPFVRVTKDGRVISSSGDLGLFMLTRPGDMREIYSLLRDGIRDQAMTLLSDAAKGGTRLAVEGVEVHSAFGSVKVDIVAHPLRDETISLIFIVQEQLKPTVSKYAVAPVTTDKRVSELQEELSQTQFQLKRKVEEVETANEELKSSNEEMMSMNEELQSANEELTTANEELKNKIDEHTLANADLDNFLGSADLAMIVLDRSLRVRHITDTATKLLAIKGTDKGRFLTEFNLPIGPDDVAKEIRQVMDTRVPYVETSQSAETDRSFYLRITPYFFKDGTVEGATITLTDISTEVALRNDLARETDRLTLALRAGRIGLADIDVENQLITIDEILAEHLGLSSHGEVGLDELTSNFFKDDIPLFSRSFEKVVETGEEDEVNFRVADPETGVRWLRTRGSLYTASDGSQRVVGPTLDVTDVTTYRERELLIREMSHRVNNLFAVISALVRVAANKHQKSDAMAEDLIARIASLGRIYDLARKNQTSESLGLKEAVEAILEPHIMSQQIEITGDTKILQADTLNTLAFIIHELATNAHKYGAFSSPNGTLKLNWETSIDGMTTFTWKELVPGFNPPKNPITNFGSTLLEGAAKHLSGEFSRRFSSTGAEIEFSLKI